LPKPFGTLDALLAPLAYQAALELGNAAHDCRNELANIASRGYTDYMRRIRFRIVPGVS
jgi:hypothetical protein